MFFSLKPLCMNVIIILYLSYYDIAGEDSTIDNYTSYVATHRQQLFFAEENWVLCVVCASVTLSDSGVKTALRQCINNNPFQ